jgi:DNA-binding response OmpR family regulator/HPt (histidine-containing phosphotransfer) domain-containing protein
MPAPADLKDVLAQLRQRYLASSGNTVAAFAQLADQLEQTPDAPEVVDTLRRELHRVHGTAGSYGLHEASRLAGALEPVAIQWTGDPQLDRARRAAIVRQFVRSLRTALSAEPEKTTADTVAVRRLLLVDVPDETATPLIAVAMHRGMQVERVTATAVKEIVAATPPSVVVAGAHVALELPDGIPHLVLRTPGAPVAPQPPTVRIFEASTDPRELLHIAESLATHAGLVGVTVLVVEDDPAMSDLLRALGERQGMFVETRGDATDIVTALDAVRPSLLLMDINMPGPNGLIVVRELRKLERFAELPIVLVSSSTDVETRTAAFSAGADDFQSKPVVPEELLRRIDRLLEIGRQRLLARGVHPSTGLWLPQRAMKVFEERLAQAAAHGDPASVALLRPHDAPDSVTTTALWHREARLVSAALATEGVLAGFRDELALLLVFPMSAAAARARLEPFAEASRSDQLPWSAGLVELRPGADPSAQRLARLAEEAWLAARERREPVHRWDEKDTGIAPDVIVVEDDAALADLVTFALASRGLTYVVYNTGPSALEGLRTLQARGRAPILLLDVDLPGLDGFSLYEQLRVERPGQFRTVFVSVHASEADQLRALRAGALDYLAKPLSLRVLMAKIASWRVAAGPSA